MEKIILGNNYNLASPRSVSSQVVLEQANGEWREFLGLVTQMDTKSLDGDSCIKRVLFY